MWMWKCTRTDSLISNISNTQPWAEHLISLYWVTSAWAQELFFSGRWREAVGPWAECSSYPELLDIIRNHNYWSFWKQQMELSSSCQGFGASWYSKPGMTRQKHYQHNIQFTVDMLCKSVFMKQTNTTQCNCRCIFQPSSCNLLCMEARFCHALKKK